MSRTMTRGAMARKASDIAKSNNNDEISTKPGSPENEGSTDHVTKTQANTGKRRKRAPRKKIDIDPNALPHGLGVKADAGTALGKGNITSTNSIQDQDDLEGRGAVKFEHDAGMKIENEPAPALCLAAEADPEPDHDLHKRKKTNKYGVVLGVTPYPDLVHPTAEEAYEVNRRLSEKHGAVKAPEDIPVPSRRVSGCGEVKFALEALVRTMISAHTTMGNAGFAIQGLIARYKFLQSGLTEGCIDWDLVRTEGREELEKAIKRGGMQKTKSRDIHATLTMVYEENKAKRAELGAKDGKLPLSKGTEQAVAEPDAAGTEKGEPLAKANPLPDTKAGIMSSLADQILRSDSSILTLDYLHALPPNEVFLHLLRFPGVGVKTAACTLLFCMQRPLFAVDTHVFRLCKWLGWAPPNATRDTAFAHCDVRVPDDLKYSLHQLMIVHGKSCGRCRAITGERSAGWDDEVCVLEDLVKRTGTRKGGADEPKTKKRKKAEAEGEGEDETEEEAGEVVLKKGRVRGKKKVVDEEVAQDAASKLEPTKGRGAKKGANSEELAQQPRARTAAKRKRADATAEEDGPKPKRSAIRRSTKEQSADTEPGIEAPAPPKKTRGGPRTAKKATEKATAAASDDQVDKDDGDLTSTDPAASKTAKRKPRGKAAAEAPSKEAKPPAPKTTGPGRTRSAAAVAGKPPAANAQAEAGDGAESSAE